MFSHFSSLRKEEIIQDASTIATLIAAITSWVTAAIGWIGDIAETVADTPILLIGIIMSCAGWAIGAIRRMINL